MEKNTTLLMEIFQKAVSDTLDRKTIDTNVIKKNFSQYERIIKMLNRLYFISQYYDEKKLRSGDMSFKTAVNLYANGKDLYEPDMNRGMNLPKLLMHMECDIYPCGLLAMGEYFMHEARYIINPTESKEPIYTELERINDDDIYKNYDFNDNFDKKLFYGETYGSCCIGMPICWKAFDIVFGITHSNL